MFVCICHSVTDEITNNSIDQGALNMRSLANNLSADTECGICTSAAKRVVNKKLMQIIDPSVPLSE